MTTDARRRTVSTPPPDPKTRCVEIATSQAVTVFGDPEEVPREPDGPVDIPAQVGANTGGDGEVVADIGKPPKF